MTPLPPHPATINTLPFLILAAIWAACWSWKRWLAYKREVRLAELEAERARALATAIGENEKVRKALEKCCALADKWVSYL